jgi:TPR repeat protein
LTWAFVGHGRRRAAAAGNAEAMSFPGGLRKRQGRVEDDDPDGAIAWWKRAAAARMPAELMSLGDLREDQGRLADDDPDGAVFWYKQGDIMGDPRASKALRRIRDPDQAEQPD